MMNSKQRLSAIAQAFIDHEPQVRAFLPETGRLERVHSELAEIMKHDGPLAGVFLGVKDIFRVDHFETRAGSQLPPAILAGPEAESVRQLKAAGCVVVGKTVTTEFAYFGPGATTNPHNSAHTPGGSSSGSAAGVAAGLCDIALGSQTIGSVIRPAAFCGVFGFKPSYDRISKENVIPLAPSLDHVGLFCRDLELLEQASKVLCRGWLEVETPERPVFAVPQGPYLEKTSAAGQKSFNRTLDQLREVGYTIIEVEMMPDFDAIDRRHRRVLAYEAAQVHEPWFDEYRGRYHHRTVELVETGRQINAGTYEIDVPGRTRLREEIMTVMRKQGIDFWLSPAAPGPAPHGLSSTGDPIMNLPWTQAGLPALNIPSDVLNGLPLGLQVNAGWYQGEALLRIGRRLAADLKGGQTDLATKLL
jgi:Asp-tRNA(Asn)/Glu-tRNA(Gln) amidotransferase A subunit family amidase